MQILLACVPIFQKHISKSAQTLKTAKVYLWCFVIVSNRHFMLKYPTLWFNRSCSVNKSRPKFIQRCGKVITNISWVIEISGGTTSYKVKETITFFTYAKLISTLKMPKLHFTSQGRDWRMKLLLANNYWKRQKRKSTK